VRRCLAVLALLPLPVAATPPCDPPLLSRTAADAGITFVHDRGGTGAKHYPETMGAGVAWLDYDGDGWLDLYLVQSGPFPPRGTPRDNAGAADRLYRNRGDGTFEDVTAGALPEEGDRGYGQGVLAADLDGDGWSDLYLANYGPDAFLRNRGDGTFEDATAVAGLGLGGWSSSAAAADYDGDGRLDLYVARYLVYPEDDPPFCGDAESGRRQYCDPALFLGEHDRLYRNLGPGDGRPVTFEDATAAAGLGGADGKGLGVVFADLDGDDLPDLYVANDLTLNLLFRNRGDGTFEELSLLSGTALNREGKPEAGMGVALGDVDGDRRPDLAVTNFDVETNTLYRNLGGLLFEDVSAPSGFGPPSFNLLAFGVVLADLDLDGALDAYVADGHVREEPRRENVHYAQRDLLLLGDGAGHFSTLRCPWLDDHPAVGRGLARVDYDRDGDPDLAVQHNHAPFELLRNEAADAGRWLGVHLRGRRPNPEGVGARVTLTTSAGVQSRWVLAGDSYQSSSAKTLHFGLGDAAPLELEIRWPSGAIRRFRSPPAGTYLSVWER